MNDAAVSEDEVILQLLERARQLASIGEDEPAKQTYIELLARNPTHFSALNELAAVALATGHRSAARTAYRQAVKCHPSNPVGRVNLGNLHFQDNDFPAARQEYEAALGVDADFPEAHQGLARTLEAMGDPVAAEPHWQRGFVGRALVARPYRGRTPGIRVLLLVSARSGNVATQLILDDRIHEVFAVYVDYHDTAQPLPTHALVFNAIGDADLCDSTLKRAQELIAQTAVPVINPPANVRLTGRVENARRLGLLSGVIAPAIRRIPRHAVADADDLRFPLLLRTPGYHMGSHFIRVERRDEWSAAAASLPGEELLAIEYLDARGSDGMVRKFRVMCVDGQLYPLHLAISADWKVHYFSAAMGAEQRFREEERRFLDAMPTVLGPRAMAALSRIFETLALDYAGIDFGLRADGSVLLFEANATMVIVPPPPDPMWDYRRAAVDRALDAAKRLVRARSGRSALP
jgi:hypothetical protein